MKEVYLIKTMKLIGATFQTFSTVKVEENSIIRDSKGKIKKVGIFESSHFFDISEEKKGYNSDTSHLLPYFAKVSEDLPFSAIKLGIKPKVYINCQLTTQFPNRYLIFKCLDSGKDLKIAMNSHYYEPKN